MNTITPQLRPELIARVQRENPSVKELTGPVVPVEKYIGGWELDEMGLASKMVAVAPQLLEAQEKKHPEIAKMMREVEKQVLSALPLQGAVVGLVLGEADRYSDDGIVSADLHALGLEAPYVSPERLGTLYVDTHGDAAYVHLEKDKISVEAPPEPDAGSAARDKNVLQTIRDLYEDAGGRLAGAPTEGYGGNRDGKLLLEFDYGTPQTLSTPSGNYSFASGSTSMQSAGKTDFRALLEQNFDVTVVTPQRDDRAFSPSSHKFQNEYSGPTLQLVPKGELHTWRNAPETMRTPEGFAEAAVRGLLEGFSQAQPGDKQLNADESGKLLEMVKGRREKLQAVDQGEKDTDTRPGHVKFVDFDTVESHLGENEVSTLVTNKYIGQTYQIERTTENGVVGIEIEGSGRYADGLAYEVTPSGGRIREFHFKEKM